MSGGNYKRATKKYAARVDHTDGDTSSGYVLVPVGMDFVATITQAVGFLAFETDNGEETFLNLVSIKRITEMDGESSRRQEQASAEQKAQEANRAKAEAASKAKAEEEARNAAAAKDTGKRTSPYSTNDHYEALDILGLGEYASPEEIQGAYRRLVKLYHPDRLRGLGVSDKKIAYAAERLAEINNAYKLLIKVAKAA